MKLHVLPILMLAACVSARSAAEGRSGLSRTVLDLAARCKARVALDPELAPEKAPVLDPALPLEPALVELCRQVPGAAWRRVYVAKKAESPAWTPARLGAVARLLGREQLGDLAVHSPDKHRVSWLRKDRPSSELGELLRKEELNPEPLYLLYSTLSESDGRAPEAQIADLQQQQLQMQARGEYAGLAYGSMVQLMQSVPREQLEAFAGRILQASNPIWDRLSAEERGGMMDGSMKLLKQFAGEGKPPAPPRAPARLIPLRNHLIELRALAADLARQHTATVAVDPGMFVLATPARLPGGGLEKSLDALARECPGVAWRRVYLPASERREVGRERVLTRLVSAVRAQESLEGSLVVEGAGTFTASLRHAASSDPEPADIEVAGLDARPVCLLYQPLPLPLAGSLEEQYAGLQRRQIELMTRMTPEQMGAALDQLVQQYHSADPSTRSGILGLPLVAGMMAVWFPRQAKERQP